MCVGVCVCVILDQATSIFRTVKDMIFGSCEWAFRYDMCMCVCVYVCVKKMTVVVPGTNQKSEHHLVV